METVADATPTLGNLSHFWQSPNAAVRVAVRVRPAIARIRFARS